jgi:hypothetical protein
MTTVKCEILCVDEYIEQEDITGDKDVYLFKVTYDDDKSNPICVLNSLRNLAAKINDKYTSRKLQSGIKLFGLNQDYIQYLIHIHVPNAQDISSVNPEVLLQRMYDNGQIDRCVNRGFKRSGEMNPFLYCVNETQNVSFDPQKQLFYI